MKRHSLRCTRFPLNSLTAAILSALAGMAQALPQGGQVAAGDASISTSGSDMTVNQSTQKLIVDWQSFGIATGESVQFLQPGSDAVALNRVLGNNSSEIYGALSANGQVFLVNPNGILFGTNAQVDVGGLVASTLNISNDDFLAGNYVFSGGEEGSVTNQGTLTAADGGVIALLAPEVRNEGLIVAKEGGIGMGAGTRIRLDLSGGLSLEVEQSALDAVIENHHALRAEGGVIILSATARQSLLAGMINNTGVIEAGSATEEGGVIRLAAGFQSLGGTISASGTGGGAVQVQGNNINQFGSISADGSTGSGGRIALIADSIVQPDSALVTANGATSGGEIDMQGRQSLFTSGTLAADGGSQGGRIELRGDALTLAAATLTATGANGGGSIHVGGDYQGIGTGQQASSTWINPFTTLDASATQNGNGGEVIVWSDVNTTFGGTALARGGAQSGDGGFIEISGHDTLQFAGVGDANASNGVDGTLLLDPRNIFISNVAVPTLQVIPLVDPAPGEGDQHGSGETQELANGNIVQVSQFDDFAATDAGAVYLYSGSNGALLSMLTGGSADDRVGNEGVTALTNGNFVVNSINWDNGAAIDAGAVTWGSGTTGISGMVSAENSLVGTSSDDFVGLQGVNALSNGNYVVNSSIWNEARGAVTWGDGTTGVSGELDAGNSLVGSTAGDFVGSRLTILSNGNYIVDSQAWDNGSLVDAGASTFGSGTTGIVGEISASNSLVGDKAFDGVGAGGSTELANGNYVVSSFDWGNGSAQQAGAVTWADGDTGITGVVSASNSLVGTTAFDHVGNGQIAVLPNGNYVVRSVEWDNGSAIDAGAVTFGNGATGITGAVSGGNSLVGTQSGDRVGQTGITVLANGNYVVSSHLWANGSAQQAGAVTWADGDSGITGAVSTSNSLVGDKTEDRVGLGELKALGNGDYVVTSLNWDNGGAIDAGAVTHGDGASGTTGVVSASNSLVGDASFDYVGSGGITELANGNYVVSSFNWSNGSALNAGAVTWADGNSGVTGVVSSSNSLVGTQAEDFIGIGGEITPLANGNYVVASELWDNGSLVDAGAVTWGNGNGGTVGAVSAGNSLVGSQAFDMVGEGEVTEVGDSNYVVRSFSWDNGALEDAGAVTWADGDTGITGEIDAGNSLVGGSAGDRIGSFGVRVLPNGNYVVNSPIWSNAGATQAGAVTWGNGNTGVTGVVSASNSLVGTQTLDRVGSNGVWVLADGNYVVDSYEWNNGSIVQAGAVTWADGDTGITGEVSTSNSLVGDRAFDQVGRGGIEPLANGDAVVRSPDWHDGTGRVDLLHAGTGSGTPLFGNLYFADNPGGNVTLSPDQITAITNTGTDLVLQANNTIVVGAAIIADNPSGDGGDLTLQAGNNLFVNADIFTDNGDLTLVASAPESSGVMPAYRDGGVASLVLNEGVTLDAGRGDVNLLVGDGKEASVMVLGNDTTVTGQRVRLRNDSFHGGIALEENVLLNATGRGIALQVGVTDDGILNSETGLSGLQTPNGYWLVYSLRDTALDFGLGDSSGLLRRLHLPLGN